MGSHREGGVSVSWLLDRPAISIMHLDGHSLVPNQVALLEIFAIIGTLTSQLHRVGVSCMDGLCKHA